jgi:cytochrome d ubiquinol oxidase subunit II
METLWFAIVAVMLTAYVVLDGFDLGAGVIYLVVARTNEERHMILRAIGPVWDGNEVWLLAAGGTLYFAFPPLYASSFSGFYLPLMIVLWLLMLRAIGIEFRAHIDDRVWQSFFDVVFSVSSIVLTIVLGAALGNVIRGVPLGADGYFFLPLWTDFRVSANPGVLDWYTVMAGVVALVTLTAHGAHYVALKTHGDLGRRSRRLAMRMWPLQLVLTGLSFGLTLLIQPSILDNFKRYPVGWLVPVVVAVSLATILWAMFRAKELIAFLASGLYIVAMLVGAVFALYPVVLPASTGAQFNLTIYTAAAGHYGLSVGLIWWSIGMVLALGYFVFVYRMFRGKVQMGEGHGY